MLCRPGCAACCIVISITSPLPGMPNGKPAGIRCVNLSEDNLCRIHTKENYPEVCKNFIATLESCGKTNEEAIDNLTRLEKETKP
ncbi:YkgJ family cysteine cluster protein [bacterium]